MRILLDECVPRRLQREFAGQIVSTVFEMGWSGKKNGELLQLAASEGFAVLITVDQNLRYQQNLMAIGLAAIVLIAPTNRLADLRPLISSVERALLTIATGDIIEIAE